MTERLATRQEIKEHLNECSEKIEITAIGDPHPRYICNCGWVHARSAWGIAWAEVNAIFNPLEQR